MTLTSRPALAQAIWPQVSVWREVLVVLLGSWLVALLAQVTIPLQPVPITGQTFGVLLVGAALGARRGAMAMLVYLAQGLLGLPFFAGGASGIGRLLGPTGGYLVGFVFAAALVGWLSECGWDRRFLSTLAAMALGSGLIYAFGVPWLAQFVAGVDRALTVGMLPFLLGDALKAVLAALMLPTAWATLGRIQSRGA